MEWKLSNVPTGNRLADAHAFSFDAVAALYDSQDPRALDTYRRRADNLAKTFTALQRQGLVRALHTYMSELNASSKALDNLHRLEQLDSVAVVTGQQSGLFGGPLYTIYKAISTVGLANRLERELGVPVVPVFWIASEDHDWAEVNHAFVLDSNDEVKRIKLQKNVRPHQMVYHNPLTSAEVDAALSELRTTIGQGPFLPELLAELQSEFLPGESLSRWFARLLAKLTGEMGLVLLDPCLPELRQLAAPVFRQALTMRDTIAAELTEAYRTVSEAGFSPEVIRDELNTTLFYVRDGERYVIEQSASDRLRVRTLQEERSLSEWLDVIDSDPTQFSSNVLCRPVVQDHLLPTLAYIGGPSEVAYYPLSRGVFHAFGRTLPPLLLRQRMTLVPPSVRRHMTSWNVTDQDIQRPLDLVGPWIQQNGKNELDALFDVLSGEAEGRWGSVARRFESLGPQVSAIVERQQAHEREAMLRAKRKLGRLIEQRGQDAVKQLRHMERWLWTDGHLQERRLSLMPFWAKYGIDWVNSLPRWDGYENPGALYLVDL